MATVKFATLLNKRKQLEQSLTRLLRDVDTYAQHPSDQQQQVNPNEQLTKAIHTAKALADLTAFINIHNATTVLPDTDVTITYAIARRNVSVLAAKSLNDLRVRQQKDYTVDLDMVDMRNKAQQLAREGRELDEKIQASNWQTDVEWE